MYCVIEHIGALKLRINYSEPSIAEVPDDASMEGSNDDAGTPMEEPTPESITRDMQKISAIGYVQIRVLYVELLLTDNHLSLQIELFYFIHCRIYCSGFNLYASNNYTKDKCSYWLY